MCIIKDADYIALVVEKGSSVYNFILLSYWSKECISRRMLTALMKCSKEAKLWQCKVFIVENETLSGLYSLLGELGTGGSINNLPSEHRQVFSMDALRHRCDFQSGCHLLVLVRFCKKLLSCIHLRILSFEFSEYVNPFCRYLGSKQTNKQIDRQMDNDKNVVTAKVSNKYCFKHLYSKH